jgi:hypothetical protein
MTEPDEDEPPGIYPELDPIGRGEAEAVFAAGGREIGFVLLRLALHYDDWAYVERRCLDFSRHPDTWVRRNVATALGQLARIHGRLHVERVMPALMTLWADPDVSGWADDALDDVEMFLKVNRGRWAH